MKYTTFRNLVAVGGVGLLGLGVWQCTRCNAADNAHADAATTTASSPAPRGATRPSNDGAPATSAEVVEPFLLAKLGKRSSGPKLKDVLGAGQPKINVYDEDGLWGRAKVDLDRDEKWDEKWTWADGVVERQVSPDDDESYSIQRRWVRGAWLGAGDDEPEVADEPAPSGGDPLLAGNAIEKAMAAARQRPVQAKIKDTTKGRPFKINIYSDDGARWNRAKVDLDRDDKWDEKWTFGHDGTDDGSIEKKVAPADDDNYTETWAWGPDGWTKI